MFFLVELLSFLYDCHILHIYYQFDRLLISVNSNTIKQSMTLLVLVIAKTKMLDNSISKITIVG